jgi:hypothetical protein
VADFPRPEETGGLPLPPDFGGLAAFWSAAGDHAIVVRYAHGQPLEGLRLDPLNALQLLKIVGHLVASGRRQGFITDEHARKAEQLPAMPAAEVDMEWVHRITGGQ